jgi:hypothetical protein
MRRISGPKEEEIIERFLTKHFEGYENEMGETCRIRVD